MSESKERSIPKPEHKLSGQYNYAAWILSIEMCLKLHDVGKTGYTVGILSVENYNSRKIKRKKRIRIRIRIRMMVKKMITK
jgi:hypothetical protein